MKDFEDLQPLGASAIARAIQSMPPVTPVYVSALPDHDRKTAEATKSMDAKLSDLVDAMHQTIEINQQAQAAAARSEKFSRRMSVASLWVSIGSLAAAVGSIVIAIVALLATR